MKDTIQETTAQIRSDPYQLQIEAILNQVFSQKRCQIYLFGSRATGTYRSTSDFDIAVLAKEDISRELSLAREMLEQSNIPLTIDLVDLNKTPVEFRQAVQNEGTLLWIN
jgi:predicted nucleotidyltransferase